MPISPSEFEKITHDACQQTMVVHGGRLYVGAEWILSQFAALVDPPMTVTVAGDLNGTSISFRATEEMGTLDQAVAMHEMAVRKLEREELRASSRVSLLESNNPTPRSAA